jgi:hypothetical protein
MHWSKFFKAMRLRARLRNKLHPADVIWQRSVMREQRPAAAKVCSFDVRETTLRSTIFIVQHLRSHSQANQRAK